VFVQINFLFFFKIVFATNKNSCIFAKVLKDVIFLEQQKLIEDI